MRNAKFWISKTSNQNIEWFTILSKMQDLIRIRIRGDIVVVSVTSLDLRFKAFFVITVIVFCILFSKISNV